MTGRAYRMDKLRRYVRSTLDITPLPFRMTAGFVLPAAGMESTLFPLDVATFESSMYHSIRLYSTKSFKSLGTLSFHRKNVDRLVFARPFVPEENENEDDSEDEDEDGYMLTTAGKEKRGRWLVSGDADGKVAIWELLDFSKK